MGGDKGTSIQHQQVGVTWPAGRTDGLVISVDLEGNLNYFLNDQVEGPVRVVRGHQKAITAAASLPASSTPDGKATLWTGSSEGRTRCWDLSSGSASLVAGEGHSNYISAIAASATRIYTTGWDDTLRAADPQTRSFARQILTKTAGQPKGIAIATANNQPTLVVATATGITLYAPDGTETATHNLPSPPTCVAASGATIAVGSEDKKIRIFSASTGPSSSLT